MCKKAIRCIVSLLALSVLLACFAGCKGEKDVYGAASDFIKVSHPDKPNTNVFSDDNYTGEKSSSSSKGTDSSEQDASVDSSSEQVSDSVDSGSGEVDANLGGSSQSTENSGGIKEESEKPDESGSKHVLEGDQGPVVDIP